MGWEDDGKFIAGRDDHWGSGHPDAHCRRQDDYGRLTRLGEEHMRGAQGSAASDPFGSTGSGGLGVVLVGFLVVVSLVFDRLLPWMATWWTPWHTGIAAIVITVLVGWQLLRRCSGRFGIPFMRHFGLLLLCC